MNRLTRRLYLPILATAALVVAGGCDGHRERRLGASDVHATVTRNWPAAGIEEVKVAEVDGNISVEAVQTSEISLLARARGRLDVRKGEENDGLFETTVEGGTLHIGRREHRHRGWNFNFFWDRSERRIDYILKVPASVSVSLATVSGRIVTRGIEGDTRATTVNGNIDVETAGTHELQATTVNGRVKAKFLRDFNGARFNTVNGGVEATLPESASFAVNLSQVNGDFEASFPLSIHSNPGSRRVSGEVNGGEHELKIVTVNGDVELSRSIAAK